MVFEPRGLEVSFLPEERTPDDVLIPSSLNVKHRISNDPEPKGFLQRYTAPLLNAPLTHVTAFLILHELTAVVPLLGLAGFFHYSEWLPPYISEGKWVSDGVQRFGNYFRKKGWLGDDGSSRYMWWGRGEGGVRVVVEYASSCCALGCSVTHERSEEDTEGVIR